MTDFVRVKCENGSDGSVSAEYAALLNLKVLDKPGADRTGVALVEKHNPLTTPKKKSGASAAADPEEKK